MERNEEVLKLYRLQSQAVLANYAFHTALVRAYDDGTITLDNVRSLISENGTKPRPSRATTFRRLAEWRELVAARELPGVGA